MHKNTDILSSIAGMMKDKHSTCDDKPEKMPKKKRKPMLIVAIATKKKKKGKK